jgi:hypothetical protein
VAAAASLSCSPSGRYGIGGRLNVNAASGVTLLENRHFLAQKAARVYSSKNASALAEAAPNWADRCGKRRNAQMAAGIGGNLLKSLIWWKEQAFVFRCAGFGFCCARL